MSSKAVEELRAVLFCWKGGQVFTKDADIVRKCAAVCEEQCSNLADMGGCNLSKGAPWRPCRACASKQAILSVLEGADD